MQSGTTVDVLSAGFHVLEFWSVDESGNAELTNYAYFTMTGPDLTAPTTTRPPLSPTHTLRRT